MNRIYKVLLLSSIIVIAGLGCKKAEGPDPLYLVSEPENLMLSLEDNSVTFTWDYADDDRITGFIVEFSEREDFGVLVETDTLAATERSKVFSDVGFITEGYARIKVIAQNPVLTSNFKNTKLNIESILLPVDNQSVTGNSVILRWTAPLTGAVDKVEVLPKAGGQPIVVQLSGSAIENRMVEVEGLESATEYYATIYDGEERKGLVLFSTVDLRAVITIGSGSDIYATLQEAINAAVTGDVINIGGATYDFEANGEVTIANKSLTIAAVPDGDMPVMTTQIFNLVGNVASLKISGIKLIVKSSQVFRLENLTGTSNIEVDNCDLSGPTAGLIYASTSSTATVGFTLKNSLVHDFGNEGGDFIDYRGGSISKLEVTNTTFWKVARGFLRIDGAVTYTGTSPMLFKNCTIDNVCSGSGSNPRFIYIRSGSAAVNFENNILTNKVANAANGISGPRVNFIDNNVYGTNSEQFAQHTSSQTGMTQLNPEYANPAAGNFTVGNADLKGQGKGDPRWLN